MIGRQLSIQQRRKAVTQQTVRGQTRNQAMAGAVVKAKTSKPGGSRVAVRAKEGRWSGGQEYRLVTEAALQLWAIEPIKKGKN